MQEVPQPGVQSQGMLQGTTPAPPSGGAVALRTSYFPVRRVSPLQGLRQAKPKMGARPDEGGARRPAVVLQAVQNEETHVDTGVTEEALVYNWRLFFSFCCLQTAIALLALWSAGKTLAYLFAMESVVH